MSPDRSLTEPCWACNRHRCPRACATAIGTTPTAAWDRVMTCRCALDHRPSTVPAACRIRINRSATTGNARRNPCSARCAGQLKFTAPLRDGFQIPKHVPFTTPARVRTGCRTSTSVRPATFSTRKLRFARRSKPTRTA
uniref:(northern house mosquito) hypothetical protein n=1 Tax=Culex pipiens TaxID=7175 RepID=A0A8D8DKR0_CULPI